MTAIAIVYTNSGFAIGADGLGSWSYEPATTTRKISRDDEQKVFEARSKQGILAFGISGVVSDPNGSFSVVDECNAVASAISQLDFNSAAEYVEEFTSLVTGAMEKAHLDRRFEYPHQQYIMSQFVFCGYFLKEPFFYGIQVRSEVDGGLSISPAVSPDLEKPLGIGSAQIANHVFFHEPGGPLDNYSTEISSNSSLEQAVASVKAYLDACSSPEGRAIDPEFCKDIGGHIHVATVTVERGFQWAIPPTNALKNPGDTL